MPWLAFPHPSSVGVPVGRIAPALTGSIRRWGGPLLRIITGRRTGLSVTRLLAVIWSPVITLVRRWIAVTLLLRSVLIIALLGLGRLLGSPVDLPAKGTGRRSQ